MDKKTEALKLALEAAKGIRLAISEGRTAHAENDAAILEHIINNALAEQPAQEDPCPGCYKGGVCRTPKCGRLKLPADHPFRSGRPTQQEQVPDALHFAQWTAAKKDLSDYILVGSLSLAGIEDGEYGTSEIDSHDNVIEALQEKLVTGPDHKEVPLLAYIGALSSPATPSSKPLTDGEIDKLCPQFEDPVRREMWIIGFKAAHGIKE